MSLVFIRGDFSQTQTGCLILAKDPSDGIHILSLDSSGIVVLSPFIQDGIPPTMTFKPLELVSLNNNSILTQFGTGINLEVADGILTLPLQNTGNVASYGPIQSISPYNYTIPLSGIWYNINGSNTTGVNVVPVSGTLITSPIGNMYDAQSSSDPYTVSPLSIFQLAFLPLYSFNASSGQEYSTVVLKAYLDTPSDFAVPSNPVYINPSTQSNVWTSLQEAQSHLLYDYCVNTQIPCAECWGVPLYGGATCAINPLVATSPSPGNPPTVMPFFPSGSAGSLGPRGGPGPAGPTGPTGETGGLGPTGPTGPSGPTGSTGPTGETGSTGPSGSAGPVGPIGPQGSGSAPGTIFWNSVGMVLMISLVVILFLTLVYVLANSYQIFNFRGESKSRLVAQL